MTSLGMVVPTRGDRPYLPSIIEASGLSSEQVAVVVTTDADIDLPAVIIRDCGPVNIQRWWNRGIEALGVDHVLLLNDDVTIPPGLVHAMSARLSATRAAACYVYGNTPSVRLTGWAFMVDVRQVRPDERFRWYYGDDDVWQQAKRAGGMTAVEIAVEHHHPGALTAENPELRALARADRAAFESKWEGVP